MDFQQETYTQKTPCQSKRSASMALASMILGIIAFLTCGCIYSAMVCGSLGVILALLSRGGEQTLDLRAKAGLILSSIGLAMTAIIYISAFFVIMRQYGGIDGFLQEYMKIYDANSIEELYQRMGIQNF